MAIWTNGENGKMEKGQCGKLQNGSLETWQNGKWRNGKMDTWQSGKLRNCKMEKGAKWLNGNMAK